MSKNRTRYRLTWRDYIYGTLGWRIAAARDWCLRWIYAQHNARVIIDFGDRMASVIHEATSYRMSKPYYTKEAMLAEIREAQERAYRDAYQEGRRDLADELDVKLDDDGQRVGQ